MDNLIITLEHDGVLTITLNRVDKKNALTTAMYNTLCDQLNFAKQNDAIRCVLIQGDHTCFCAGNDLQDFIQFKDDEELAALTFVKTLGAFTKPLVAAVAGPAVGIGTTMLLHCDMVFATESTLFKLPFTQLGLCPEAGASYLLPLKVGQNKAFELMVLGKSFSAQQALEMGIINDICDSSTLLDIALHCALTIAKLPHQSVMESKRLIRQASQQHLSAVMKDEGDTFEKLLKTEDCQQVLAKFFR